MQNTLTPTGNYTIGTYNAGIFTINGLTVTPINSPSPTIIPTTVTSVSQKPSLNNTFNQNSSPTDSWQTQDEENQDNLLSLEPAAGENENGVYKTHKAAARHKMLEIDPILAKHFELNQNPNI